MAIYSKICIMCNNEFRTMRINSVFCGKRCGNRSRTLPPQIRQNLIGRNSQFTMVLDTRPKHRIQDENGLLMALAKAEAKRRGIVDRDVIDNTKYINTIDPANGDSTGFGVKQEDKNDNTSVVDNHNNNAAENREGKDTNGSNDNISTIPISSIGSRQTKGIRKLGGLKTI